MNKQQNIFTIEENTVLALSKKDIDAYNKQQKSYELNNWLKDELVIRSALNGFKELKFSTTCKAFARLVNNLGYFVEQNIVTKTSIKILDTKTVEVSYLVELDNLDNKYRRYLNLNYNCVELPYIKDGETTDEFDTIQHEFC